jgi:hypothetical protein
MDWRRVWRRWRGKSDPQRPGGAWVQAVRDVGAR